jgi:hypothetical protein
LQYTYDRSNPCSIILVLYEVDLKRGLRVNYLQKSRLFIIAFALILLLVPAHLFLFGNVSAVSSSSTKSAALTFGTPINLSNDQFQAEFPNVVNVGDHVYVSWTEESRGIYFRASNNSGTSWIPPTNQQALKISSGSGGASYSLMSANGSDVYIVWSQSMGGAAQIYFSASTNFGVSFSVPIVVDTTSTPSSITPVIASWGSTVAVAWVTNVHSYVRTSSNGGNTWNPVLQFSTSREPEIAIWEQDVYAIADNMSLAVSHNSGVSWTVDNVGHGSEAWIGAYGSNLIVSWETKGPASVAYLLVSNNYGTDYTVKVLTTTISDSWAPMVNTFGNSAWIAVHTNPGGSGSQVYVFTTSNSGATWSSPTSLTGALGEGTTTGFPFNVATSDGQNIFVAWPQQVSSGYFVLRVSYSTNGGTTWSAQPGIDVSQNPKGTEASSNNDVATAEISAYGAQCFAVYQYTNGASNQIYFAAS